MTDHRTILKRNAKSAYAKNGLSNNRAALSAYLQAAKRRVERIPLGLLPSSQLHSGALADSRGTQGNNLMGKGRSGLRKMSHEIDYVNN